MIVAVAMLAGAATASAAKLTIKTSDKEVLFGDRISIDGKLVPDAGAAAGGNEVRLFEQRFPYETSRVIETTTTNSKGRYEFRRIRPEFNTRYRAAFTDSGTAARSQLIDVYSLPSFTQEGRVTGDRSFRTSVTISYSPKLRTVPDATVVFYFRKVDDRVGVRKDVASAREVRPGRQFAKGSFGLPNGDYRFVSNACIQFPDREFGLFSPRLSGRCPRKLSPTSGRVPAAQPLTAFSSRSANLFIP